MLQGVLGGKAVKIKVLLSQGLLEEKHPFPSASFLATKLKTNLTSKGQTNKQPPVKPPEWLILFPCLFKPSPHPTASLPPRVAFCRTHAAHFPGTGWHGQRWHWHVPRSVGISFLRSLKYWTDISCGERRTHTHTHTQSLCFRSRCWNRPGRLTPKSRKSNLGGFCSER